MTIILTPQSKAFYVRNTMILDSFLRGLHSDRKLDFKCIIFTPTKFIPSYEKDILLIVDFKFFFKFLSQTLEDTTKAPVVSTVHTTSNSKLCYFVALQ